MQKAAIKAFLCSFSISMLAFSVANRAFWHEKQNLNSSIDISNKNIALFVKNLQTYRHPVKKIDLNVLADTTPSHNSQNFADGSYDDSYDDIIIADDTEYIAIPPKEEISVALADVQPLSEDIEPKVIEEKVVYAANLPIEQPQIEEKAVYSPEDTTINHADEPKGIVYAEAEEEKNISAPPPKVALKNSPIPLVFEKSKQTKEIALGNAEDMNHVAMATENATIESMAKKIDNIPQEDNSKTWQSLNDNPWVVAKANGLNRNQLANNKSSQNNSELADALNIHKSKEGVEVASETVKNLIIPLPENLANDDKLMPKLAYPTSSDDAKKEKMMNARSLLEETEKEQKSLLTEIDDEDIEMSPAPPEDNEEPKEKPKKDKSILSSLGDMLTSKIKNTEKTASKAKTRAAARSSIARAAKANKPVNIIPKEIKMSFQPNKAEISGQTLRWVQAFATKAAKEDRTSLEVRIDGSRPSILQQRRLNMLYNILTNKGVEYSKINVVFTEREPNSFILRMINSNSKEQENSVKINKSGYNHLQW